MTADKQWKNYTESPQWNTFYPTLVKVQDDQVKRVSLQIFT
jgi:hypothetical protein